MKDIYPKVKPEDFPELFTKHMSAMTEHGLERKSDIAAQLAWRDARIEALQKMLYGVASIQEIICGLQEDLQSTLSMYQEGSPGCG